MYERLLYAINNGAAIDAGNVALLAVADNDMSGMPCRYHGGCPHDGTTGHRPRS